NAGLHAKCHFILRNSRGDFRIAHVGQLLAVKGLHAVEQAAAVVARDARRIGKKEDRIALAAEFDPLMNAGQKAVAPQRASASSDLSGDHDDVGRQIAVLAAQAIRDPRADATPAEPAKSRVKHELGGTVVDLLSVQRFYYGDVVGHARQVRTQLRK